MVWNRSVVVGLVAGLAFVTVLATSVWAAGGRNHTSPAGHSSHGPSPAIAHPEISGLRAVTRERVDPPTPAYDFQLVDQFGQGASLQGLAGRVVLLSFIYTNCPEACPLLTAHYLNLQQRFGTALDSEALALVLVTTDPDHDTPQHLKYYTDGRGGRWLFLSGDLPALQATWDGYGIYREARPGLKEVVVYHTYKTALIDPKGMIHYVYQGVWQLEDVVGDIEELLNRG
ncbi:MAG: SCO family protein [Chloroflexi bacterium]|nr:SCO family protein [Chloroflexota bacterium]